MATLKELMGEVDKEMDYLTILEAQCIDTESWSQSG